MALIHLSFLILSVMGCIVIGPVGAIDHIVGASTGWTIPPNLTFYEDWARSRNFVVGDKLVFLFTTGMHNVLEVSKKDFETCGQDSVIDMHYKGPLILPLTTAGKHYYYCGVGIHCEGGQKLSITVSATATTSQALSPAAGPTSSAVDPTDNKSSADTVHYACIFIVTLLLSLFSLLM